MVRIVDRDAKRQQILEASAICFARDGYNATSMERVAGAAGVSKGSLYDYFHNKEELFFAAFEWLQRLVKQASRKDVGAHDSAREHILAFADSIARALVEHVELYPIFLDAWTATAKSGTRERFSSAMTNSYAAYHQHFARLLREAQRQGDIRLDMDVDSIAGMLTNAVDSVGLQFWLDKSIDPQQWTRSFVISLFEGLGNADLKGRK